MYKLLFVPFLVLFSFHNGRGQDSLYRKPSAKKIVLVACTHAALWTGAYILLNNAWYKDYERESFHFFNDIGELNQMDKIGHVWTAYQVSRLSTEMWKWSGLPDKTSIILGSVSAMAYQSIIEVQDGFSSEWGFSWGDMAANTIGAGSYAVQQLAWKEQRILIKMSYWQHDYPAALVPRRDQLFGTGLSERILKDYNSQTYWASANLKAFLPQSNLPGWLNVAVGYSSDLMVGGRVNSWTDKEGVFNDYTAIPRVRRFYLAPDIDLTRIKTRSKIIRGLFFALNAVKFPAPALELNSKGKIKLHGIYF